MATTPTPTNQNPPPVVQPREEKRELRIPPPGPSNLLVTTPTLSKLPLAAHSSEYQAKHRGDRETE